MWTLFQFCFLVCNTDNNITLNLAYNKYSVILISFLLTSFYMCLLPSYCHRTHTYTHIHIVFMRISVILSKFLILEIKECHCTSSSNQSSAKIIKETKFRITASHSNSFAYLKGMAHAVWIAFALNLSWPYKTSKWKNLGSHYGEKWKGKFNDYGFI